MNANEIETYTKTTTGFVTQTFVKRGDNFICSDQEFIAGDECDYEVDGEPIDSDLVSDKELYQTYGMANPDGGDIIDDKWSITDVQDRYKDEDDADDNDKEPLSDDIARKILNLCHDKMDANVGINWDVIDYWTNEVLDPDSRVNQ